MATFIYSGFENLYLRMLMNLGFISLINNFTSFIISLRSFSEYSVNFSISLFQQSIFLSYLADKIRQLAASILGLNFRKAASSKQISIINWAKKKISSSFTAGVILRYLCKNIYYEGDVILKSSVCKIYFSIAIT